MENLWGFCKHSYFAFCCYMKIWKLIQYDVWIFKVPTAVNSGCYLENIFWGFFFVCESSPSAERVHVAVLKVRRFIGDLLRISDMLIYSNRASLSEEERGL